MPPPLPRSLSTFEPPNELYVFYVFYVEITVTGGRVVRARACTRTTMTERGLLYPPDFNFSFPVRVYEDMFKTLLLREPVPDGVYRINASDFPIARSPLSPEPQTLPKESLPGNGVSPAPPWSQCTEDGYLDIPLPTYEEWHRIMMHHGRRVCSRRQPHIPILFPWNTKYNAAVFRGSPTGIGTTPETNPRIRAHTMSPHPALDIGVSSTRLRRRVHSDGASDTDCTGWTFPPAKSFIPFIAQKKYKYIVHIEGNSAAFRLAEELGSGSCVLKVESRYRLWFECNLSAWEHYIPIRHDLSNLKSTVEWCLDHDDECKSIAENALRFYNTYLGETSMLDRLSELVQSSQVVGAYPHKNGLRLGVSRQGQKN